MEAKGQYLRVLIYSKDRPWQLRQLLRTLLKHFKYDESRTVVDLNVLYTYDEKLDAKEEVPGGQNHLFSRLYEEDLQAEFAECRHLKFIKEEKAKVVEQLDEILLSEPPNQSG